MGAASALPKVHEFMTLPAYRNQLPSNSNSGDVRRQSTACRGASHAFALATPTNPLPKVYVGTNGALAAAASAGMEKRVQQGQIIDSNGPRREGHCTKTPCRFGTSDAAETFREKSPSYAAALRATSKSPASLESTSNSRRPFPSQTLRENGIDTPATTSRLTDKAVVGATGSLVTLFESKQDAKRNVPITHSVRYVTKPTPAIASPTPIKPLLRPTLSTPNSSSTYALESELKTDVTALSSAKMNTAAAAAAANSAGRAKAATIRLSKSAHSIVLPRTVPGPPAPRRSGERTRLDAASENSKSSSRIAIGGAPLASAQARPAGPSTAFLTTRSDPAFPLLTPSSGPPSRPLLPPRSSTSFETKIDSLANTIVAASLASSRAPSPTKQPPPQPRRHKSHSIFHNHYSQEQLSRTPGSAKAMRQTMRGQLPSDDEMEYKKRSILMRKHPHKHHEGDRTRYKATVTERERRRYDGVWAANKGIWMDANSADKVLNLVVRDIWSRSHLSIDVLAEIWNLVTPGSDSLNRNEFVVGMWLIDQRLKGRKLPPMVSESLWNSLHGIKVSRHQH